MNNPAWNGILFLQMAIAGVPEPLAAGRAAMPNPDALFAHHLAVQISSLSGSLPSQSDISGLINYRETDGPGLVVDGTPIRALDVGFAHGRIASFRIDPPVLSFTYKGVNWLPSG